jgi:serine/threonine-protein kinase
MRDFETYQILEELPHETIASVYRAVERTAGVEVKIYHYVLPLTLLRPREGRRLRLAVGPDLFLREATQASRLSHPGIVRIFGSGEWEGRFYMTTEIVEGSALNIKVGTPLDIAVSLDLLRQSAAALDYAHRTGVAHLALKPANLMVNDGRLRLTGFAESTIGDWTYGLMPDLIAPPAPWFLAPERFTNQACGAMADQFSLAAIAFQMLTGQTPFNSLDGVAGIFQTLQGTRPVAHEVNPEVPRQVSEALRRGLAIQPEDRFSSCGELVSAIEDALREKRL